MKLLKSIIKSAFNKLGYNIVLLQKECENPFDVLDFIIQNHLERSQKFYFVQIGAHDGLRNDHIRPLVMKYHFEGLLVEPMFDFFKDLCKNYESESKLKFENCAIGPNNGEMSLFRFKRDAPLPKDFYHGLARFDKDYILKRAKLNGLGNYVEELKVPTLTFSSLMDKHSVNKISLLQIDTEGYDFEVLKMVFSSNMFPDIINYEWTELSPKDRYECRCMLKEKNYSFVNVGANTLALFNTF